MAVHEGVLDGRRTITIASGPLEATFMPELGMLGCSLLHEHEQLLELPGGIDAYTEAGKTMGIPFLHPWANRLSGFEYEAAGRRVRLDPSSAVVTQKDGLPIHGLLTASPHWEAAEVGDAGLRAELQFGAHEELLAAFPYPHRVVIEAAVTDSMLTMRTTVVPEAGPVPICFGFHPYLRLPGLPREAWEVDLPVSRRLVLDAGMIPTGETEPVSYELAPLGERAFDDGYEGVEDGAEFVLAGNGRELRVTFLEGYPCAQVYAPPGNDLVCFEPMTAPANALVSGLGLRVAEEPFTAAFSIGIRPPRATGWPP